MSSTALSCISSGFAVLGSAPVNPYRMRNPRLGMFLAVLAGPVSNLLVAALFAVPFRLGLLSPFQAGAVGNVLPHLGLILGDMVALNVLLGRCNRVPVLPHD